ncbi:MAG: pantetheine-phosphate adenylyltransferase [Actinobacteria bacterium]|nr:pantetheine-phosphate adenylyltransferase [Actinomycetota bacterium]MBV8961331.1 pantetheine-phosphate adenylyltransferase [Actinomycetota bacterium]MBV9662858.1 pantetheine-phosphate adenylyltransferase [Actinomycetota bacterium]MBV9936540.1 pantetheine-phosphate adenylyltransferase [Actinomycetota bacterium]
MRTALYPGSFDPIHNGHLEIVETAARLFDHVIVAAIRNTQKAVSLFTLEERQQMIEESVAHLPNVKVDSLAGLAVDLARDVGADVIVKGLRVASDADVELQQAQMNRAVSGIVTLFIPATSSHSFIASKYVRDFAKYGSAERVDSMVPGPVLKRLREKFAQ